jgi:uncharacterized protein (DUF2344 family)
MEDRIVGWTEELGREAMSAELADLLKTLAIVAGALVTLAGGYYAFRNQAMTEANTTITMLEKQNDLLIKQNEQLEEQRKTSDETWMKREGDWLKVEQKLEKRISEIERDYRTLVLTVTTMGFCANAATCLQYNPGDRRGAKG